MKPIAVFQHTPHAGPGAVTSTLEQLGQEVELIRIFDGEAVPRTPDAFAGLVFMGGAMSVHDPLPWISQETELIRKADAADVPIAGHCLGGQIVAKALGGSVHANHVQELGWGEIQAASGVVSQQWWGDLAGKGIETFQWHQETFDPPTDAVVLATGEHCRNQAFVVRGLHLLIQSHFEFTHSLIERTLEGGSRQLANQIAIGNPAAQKATEILDRVGERTAQMHEVLRRLYARWLARAA